MITRRADDDDYYNGDKDVGDDDDDDDMLVNLLEKIVWLGRPICALVGRQKVALWPQHLPNYSEGDR